MSHPEPTAAGRIFLLLDEQLQRLRTRREDVFRALRADIMRSHESDAKSKVDLLFSIRELERIAESISCAQSLRAPAKEKLYIISSLFLAECHHYLTKNSPLETVVYVTGVEFRGIYIPSKIISFKLEEQSPVYAKGDEADRHSSLVFLAEARHKLLGVFHNHIANGHSAVNPSSIDVGSQERLERCGYSAISGIFSADGWVRFFTNRMPFQIEIYGEGVKDHGNGTFHMEVGDGSLSRDAGQASR